MLIVSRASGDSIRIPRKLWPRVAVLAFFNIACWNGLVLFGVQQLPAGRSAILAYTMPVWATMIAAIVLGERLSRRKMLGLVLGIAGMAVLIGEQIAIVRAAPLGALLILAAAITWAMGTVLLRKWQPRIAMDRSLRHEIGIVRIGIRMRDGGNGIGRFRRHRPTIAGRRMLLLRPTSND